jgi:thioredoxin reductase (NADPH)
MIAADDLRAVPLFAGIEGEEFQRLIRRSADLHFRHGDYIAHEGDERVLFAVLAGTVEVTKAFDGVERVIGSRSAGEIFGEMSIALGTSHPASFRAVDDVRVMRIEARDFYAISAVHPEVAARVGALARQRVSWLEELAATRPEPQAIVIGERYDKPCRDLRSFLDRNGVSFEWLTPANSGIEERISGYASIRGRFPAVSLRCGGLLLQPERRELADRIGLTTKPTQREYDTVIVGGGPAGLAAAVYGASEGLRTLMVEHEAPGGQAGTSTRIENYLGFPSGVSGEELARRALAQAKRFGAEVLVTRRVVDIDAATRQLELDGNELVRTKSVIIATGVSWRKISIDGFDRLTGKGVYYGASRGEASSLQGLDVFLVGAGNSAGQAALFFSGYARSVTLLVRGPSLERTMSQYLIMQLLATANVSTRFNTEVTGVSGSDRLQAIDVTCDGSVERLDAAALYIFIGADAQTSWLPPQIERDKLGYILTGDDVPADSGWPLARGRYHLETSLPGIFAAGDVRSRSIKRVAAGVGEGSMAIAFVHQFLQADEAVASAR